MTTEVKYSLTTLAAGQSLEADSVLHKAVAIGGTIAATNVTAVGLIKSKAANGNAVSVAYNGEMKGWAGAAITAGSRLAVTTSGYLITTTDSRASVGRALETAASGDLFRGLFDFVNAS